MVYIKQCCILTLLLLPLSTLADVYQWRDSAGKLHYSDSKPSAGSFKNISQRLDRVKIDRSHALRKDLSDVFTPIGTIEKQWLKEQKRQLVAQVKDICIKEQLVLSLLQSPVHISGQRGVRL